MNMIKFRFCRQIGARRLRERIHMQGGIAVCAGVLALLIAASVTARPVTDGPDDLDKSAAYLGLSAGETARLRAHKGGIPTHPRMTYEVLPFRYQPVHDLPLAVFLDDLKESPAYHENIGIAILEIVNVQIIMPRRNIVLPDSSVLHASLSHHGRTIELEIHMMLRDRNRYYVALPEIAQVDILSAINGLFDNEKGISGYPTLRLAYMSGFELNETTIENAPPLGVPLIHNINFGSVRVDTGYQWAYRPTGLPGVDKEGFVR